MVLGLQGYNTLVDFGAEESLGTMVALSLVRELGPVVSALLYAGRAGSALTAEIGLMKATEQLSSMEMMAVDPFKRVLAPRFFGWLDCFAVVGLDLYGHWYFRQLYDRRGFIRRGWWCVLVTDAGHGRVAR